MPHPPRPNIPGATYHVVGKGTNSEPIFFDDVDRMAFLFMLSEVTQRYSWVVLAYCLMTNHYHLVLRVPEGGLSDGMRRRHTGYSTQTTRRHGRSMHLFRQRFFSLLIESETHLLQACRYTVVNPVQAGLCERPADWPWSSYRGCAGIEVASGLLAVHDLLVNFGRGVLEAETAYRTFVDEAPTQVSDTWVYV